MTINLIKTNLHSVKKAHLLLAVAFTFSIIISSFVYHLTAAAAATVAMVRFDRMKVSTYTSGMVCFTPATVGTAATVKVTFPTGYTLGTAANFTVGTSDILSGSTAWPGIGTATNVTGQVVTFPSTTLTVGTQYCFDWTNTSVAVQQPSSPGSSEAGTIATYTSGAALIDTSGYSTATVSDDSILVTATVPQTFSFALSANTDPLGTLTTGSVTTSGTPRTVTVSTNAKSGWMVWAKDTNTGLKSANAGNYTVNSTTPGSNTTLVAGTEGYNTGITASQGGTSGGTLTVAAPFVGGSLGKGGGLDTTYRTLASSNGTAANAVMTLNNNVAISGVTPAATDYTDTIYVTGAGLF